METQSSPEQKETEDLYIHKHIHVHMSKLINISDDVYKELKRRKGEKSFSEVIQDLVLVKSNKEQLLSHYGKGGIDIKKITALKKEWKAWTEKYV